MSEQEVRDGLAALVVDEPPLAFDPDALMARADASIRRRRTLVGAGSATVVIAAAAVALPITLRGGSSGGIPVGQPGPGTSITTTVSAPPVTTPPPTSAGGADFPWPPPHNVVPDYSVQRLEQVAHTLQAEAKRVLPTVLPGATGVQAELFTGEAEGDYHQGQLYLNGAVHYKTALGKAAVDIQVNAGASVAPADMCKVKNSCKYKPQKDGSLVIVRSWGQNRMRVVTVEHYRLDGVVVSASGYNTDSFGESPTPYLSKIPISEKQLTSLATDKALTM